MSDESRGRATTAQILAPAETYVRVCSLCGRNDRFTPFTGKRHYYLGERCTGTLVRIRYRKVAS
jgi:hypothetical protein